MSIEALRDRVRKEINPSANRGAIEEVARLCHETNRVYCDIIGDEPQPTWEDAPKWQKDSAIAGVQKILSDPFQINPIQAHNSWMSQKLRDGWRYGEKKDSELKTHPNLLPYEELPEEQQVKDAIFINMVHVMLFRFRVKPPAQEQQVQ